MQWTGNCKQSIINGPFCAVEIYNKIKKTINIFKLYYGLFNESFLVYFVVLFKIQHILSDPQAQMNTG